MAMAAGGDEVLICRRAATKPPSLLLFNLETTTTYNHKLTSKASNLIHLEYQQHPAVMYQIVGRIDVVVMATGEAEVRVNGRVGMNPPSPSLFNHQPIAITVIADSLPERLMTIQLMASRISLSARCKREARVNHAVKPLSLPPIHHKPVTTTNFDNN